MDGSAHDDPDDEKLAPLCDARIPVGLIALWTGNSLTCIPVASLPPPHGAGCEGCAACCPAAQPADY